MRRPSRAIAYPKGAATLSVRSARGRYQPRTAPRLLAAERQVACGTKPEQQLECTACAAHTTRPHFREACGPEGPPSRAVFPTLLAVWKVTADLATTGRASGKEETSRPPPPLRTGRASFPASGSSSLQPIRVTADGHGKARAVAILTIPDPSLSFHLVQPRTVCRAGAPSWPGRHRKTCVHICLR